MKTIIVLVFFCSNLVYCQIPHSVFDRNNYQELWYGLGDNADLKMLTSHELLQILPEQISDQLWPQIEDEQARNHRQENGNNFCRFSMVRFWHPHKPITKKREALADLIKNASAIYLVEIEMLQVGFYKTSLASLARCRLIQTIRGEEPTERHLYIPFESAQLDLKDITLCASSLKLHYPPTQGQQLLVFDFIGPLNSNNNFYDPGPEMVLLRGEDDSIQAAQMFSEDPLIMELKTFSALLSIM